MARLSFWKLNEASSGNGPSSAADADASPVNLAITVGSNGSASTSDAAGNGYNFLRGATESSFISAALNGTKISSALTGATQATWIVKTQRGGSDSTWPVVALADASDASYFEFYADGRLFFGNQEGASINGLPAYDTAMHVIALVADSTQGTAANRILVYIDGTMVQASGTGISLNQVIDSGATWSNLHIYVGNNPGNSSVNSVIKCALLYDTALSAGSVASISTALAANDDADPSPVAVNSNPPVGSSRNSGRGFMVYES